MTLNIKFVNMLESRIADVGGISSTDLILNLTTGDGAKIPTLGTGGYIYAYLKDDIGNWELVKISSITGDECTIDSLSDRGLGGSSAAAWAEDDVVHFAPCAEELEDIVAELSNIPESGTILSGFIQNAAPTGWTRKTDLQDYAMMCISSTGNPTAGGSVNPQQAHTHAGPGHYHTGPNHLHTGPAHNHAPGTLQFCVAQYVDSGLRFWDSVGDTKIEFRTSANTAETGSGSRAFFNMASNSLLYTLTASSSGMSAEGGAANTTYAGTGPTGVGGTEPTAGNTAPYYQEVIVCTKD